MFSLSKSLFRLRGLTKLRTSPLYQLYAQASAMSYLNTPRFSFSSQPEKKEEDEVDSHDDFKPKSKVQITEENVFEQIDDWVKNNKCVLFMKGVPQMPQCGYSKFAVEVLKYYKVKNYKAVDVLKDPILREAVKKYSDWNTYPQLYVGGKLIGGADIMNEMHKEGTLKELFQQNGLTE